MEIVVFPRLGLRVGNIVFTGMKVETFTLSIMVYIHTNGRPRLNSRGIQHTVRALSVES